MASPRQLAANRRNGAKGGPKTEAGKERSRLSSLKHGLTASVLVVLPEEDANEYHEVLRGFRESFHPANPAEDALVLRLAQTHWRSLRSRRVETAILHVTANNKREYACSLVENPPSPADLNPHEAIALAFMTLPAEHWQQYLRYDTTISRDFFKTLDALQKLQRARTCGAGPRPAAASRAAVSPLTMVAGCSAAPSENGTGFVSQNPAIAPQAQETSEVPMQEDTPVEHPAHDRQRNPTPARPGDRFYPFVHAVVPESNTPLANCVENAVRAVADHVLSAARDSS